MAISMVTYDNARRNAAKLSARNFSNNMVWYGLTVSSELNSGNYTKHLTLCKIKQSMLLDRIHWFEYKQKAN